MVFKAPYKILTFANKILTLANENTVETVYSKVDYSKVPDKVKLYLAPFPMLTMLI